LSRLHLSGVVRGSGGVETSKLASDTKLRALITSAVTAYDLEGGFHSAINLTEDSFRSEMNMEGRFGTSLIGGNSRKEPDLWDVVAIKSSCRCL
jgi:hypothetical protein